MRVKYMELFDFSHICSMFSSRPRPVHRTVQVCRGSDQLLRPDQTNWRSAESWESELQLLGPGGGGLRPDLPEHLRQVQPGECLQPEPEVWAGLAGVRRDLLWGERLPPGLLPDCLHWRSDPGAEPGHNIPASQQLLSPHRQEGGGNVQENNSPNDPVLSDQGINTSIVLCKRFVSVPWELHLSVQWEHWGLLGPLLHSGGWAILPGGSPPQQQVLTLRYRPGWLRGEASTLLSVF